MTMYRCCEHCVDDPEFHENPEAVNTHTVSCSTGPGNRCLVGDSLVSTAVIEYCAHDWSLTGAEGPAVLLGRPVILWTCDGCGAAVLDTEVTS